MRTRRRTLAVVSHAAVNATHRAVYERLAQERGWEVHLIAPTSIPTGANGEVKRCDPEVEGGRVRLHTLPLALPRSGRLLWFRGMVPLLASLRPAVVFAEYDPGSLPVLLAKAAVRPFGGRVVAYTVENLFHPRFRQAVEDALRRDVRAFVRDVGVGTLDALGERVADSLVCISPEGEAVYREQRGWRRRISTIPLGTDLELFRPIDVGAWREELGLKGRFVVGYFGRLVPEKGPDLLIEALARLPSDVALLLDMFKNFAPGSFADGILRRARQLGVADRVVTIDVPHAEVPRAMNVCDVIALPSRTTPRWKEQFGRVLPEAMACGVPVIGSDSGNIPHLVGDAGVLFAEGDLDGLVEAILSLKADPARVEQLARRGRERVAGALSVEVQTDAMDRELSAVAGGAP